MWHIILFLISLNCLAQYELEPIVVSSQTKTNSKYLTFSTEVITDNELNDDQQLIESLNSVPGVHINQSGAMGSLSSIHIRGSEFRHVVVMVDGVRIYDPSSTDRIVDLSFLNNIDIEKVEILKGSQGLLYGADAIGGVVNIITKKNIGTIKKMIGISTGSINSLSSTINSSELFLSAQLEESKLISAAKNGNEKDGYKAKSFSLNWIKIFNELWSSTFGVKYLENEAQTDAGAFIDDNNSLSKREQMLLNWNLAYDGDEMQFENQISYNSHKRKSISSFGEFPFNGSSFSQQAIFTVSKNDLKFLIGQRFDNELMSSSDLTEVSASNLGLYGQIQANFKDTFYNMGVRSDFHEEFGVVANISIGAGRVYGDWILKANASTGHKPPSLYQLYGPDIASISCKVGNIDLSPETSKSAELSLSSSKVQFQFFMNEFSNFISFDCAKGYENIQIFNNYGAEVSYKDNLTKNLTLRTSLMLASFNRNDDLEVARRPNAEVKINLKYTISDAIFFKVEQKSYSSSFDYVGTQKYTLKPYHLTDVTLSYTKKNYDLNLSINNIFDESYMQAIGFSRPGINGNLKANYHF